MTIIDLQKIIFCFLTAFLIVYFLLFPGLRLSKYLQNQFNVTYKHIIACAVITAISGLFIVFFIYAIFKK